MHLKRYQRETVQEALRAVREELGPDALVLSTRMVAAAGVRGWFGRRVVEVTAASPRAGVSDDRHASESPAAVRLQMSMQSALEATASAAKTLATKAAAAKAASATRASAAKALAAKAAALAEDGIAARLAATGLDAVIAREVAQAMPKHRRRHADARTVRKTLGEQLTPLAARDRSFAPIEVFIGPPGVGKTTTIAKIAALERAKGGKRLGLLSADGFRVGAVEQLRLYADILGTPLVVARTPVELEDALEGAKRPLLLDTAGRSPSDEMSREMLRVLASRSDVRTHLVMSAATPVQTLRRIFERFESARPSRVVLTKLDEAESLAPIVALLKERGLPISYLGIGQAVPEDLQRATPATLAAWVAGDPVGARRDERTQGAVA